MNNRDRKPNIFNYQVNCDQEFFAMITKEIEQAITFQMVKNGTRNQSRINKFRDKLLPASSKSHGFYKGFRLLMMLLCGLLSLLTALILFTNPTDPLFWAMFVGYCSVGICFYYLKTPLNIKPTSKIKLNKRVVKISTNRILKKARKYLPFTGLYEFSTNEKSMGMVTHHRIQASAKNFGYTAKLPKFAIVHAHVTVLFDNEKSQIARMAIFHKNSTQILPILEFYQTAFIYYSDDLFNELLDEEKQVFNDS